MPHLKEGNPEEKVDGHGFKWGAELGVGRKKKDVMFYESFTFDGEEYFLYDCVYFGNRQQPEASIGKLVKMFEGPNHVKRVKVVWFLRPCEIRNYLGNYEPRWNEIFLASGKGLGVSNFNLVEAICGKCNVVCTSNDHRNPQASEADLRGADFFFHCHFDVGLCAILDVFRDLVDGVGVERFFNKKTKQNPLGPQNLKLNVKEQTGIPNFSFKLKEKTAIANIAKDGNSGSKVNPLVKESKAVPVSTSKQLHLQTDNTLSRLKTTVPNGGAQHGGSSCCQVQDKVDKAVEFPEDSVISRAEFQPYKKRKLFPDEMASGKFDNQDCQQQQDRGINIDNQLVQRKILSDEMASSKFDNHDYQQRQDRGINSDNQLVQRKLVLDEMASSKFDNRDCQEQQDRGMNIDNQLVQRELLPDEIASSKVDNQDCQQRQDRGINIDNQLVQRKLLPDEMGSGKFDNQDCQQRQDKGINIANQLVQISSRTADRRNWFKQLPWEERLLRAEEAGTLVSLENLDASYSSKEVEDLLWNVFKEKVEAKMIEKNTFSCPYFGEALIIFNSKEAAVSAISQLMRKCLILADGSFLSCVQETSCSNLAVRNSFYTLNPGPVIARKGTFRKPVKLAGFVGHLTIDKVQLQRQNEEKRKAKSTSHAAQPNNIEYEMGMQWCILQEKSDMYWKALHERQEKEIQDVQK